MKKPKISAKKHSKKSKKYDDSKVDRALNGQKIHYDMGIDIVKKPKKSKRKAKNTISNVYDVTDVQSIPNS